MSPDEKFTQGAKRQHDINLLSVFVHNFKVFFYTIITILQVLYDYY